MNILILENEGSASFYMIEGLKDKGHIILDAANIYDAQDHWENREKVPINCMIVDLNMPADGLSDGEIKKVEKGQLAGWVWLQERIFKEEPSMRQKVIIYTAFEDVLKKSAGTKELSGLRIVNKGDSPGEKILNHVADIQTIVEGKRKT
jgi:hypothetical protein